MQTGSRVAIGLVVAFGVVVLAAVAAVVITIGAAGAQDSVEPTERRIEVTWTEPTDVRVRPIHGGLEPATVLRMSVVGFPSHTTGTVRQCSVGDTQVCRNDLPVRTDERGAAVFQYLVTDTIDRDGACRLDSSRRCTIEVAIGDRESTIDTVFVDEAPAPGRVTLDPVAGPSIGDTVTAELVGFPAGTEITVVVCAAPATSGPRCSPPGPTAGVVTDADGSGRVDVDLDVGTVGDAEVACDRRTTCHVVATSPSVGVRAAPAPLVFAASTGADYDGTRVITGLAVAAGLVLAALVLVRITDWRPPAEADSSAIDEAAFADLDAEIDIFEEAGAP